MISPRLQSTPHGTLQSRKVIVRVRHILGPVVQNVFPHIPGDALFRKPCRDALSEVVDPHVLKLNFLAQPRHRAADTLTIDVRLAWRPLVTRSREIGRKNKLAPTIQRKRAAKERDYLWSQR
jgi:hypothetical protein